MGTGMHFTWGSYDHNPTNWQQAWNLDMKLIFNCLLELLCSLFVAFKIEWVKMFSWLGLEVVLLPLPGEPIPNDHHDHRFPLFVMPLIMPVNWPTIWWLKSLGGAQLAPKIMLNGWKWTLKNNASIVWWSELSVYIIMPFKLPDNRLYNFNMYSYKLDHA